MNNLMLTALYMTAFILLNAVLLKILLLLTRSSLDLKTYVCSAIITLIVVSFGILISLENAKEFILAYIVLRAVAFNIFLISQTKNAEEAK